jgi:type II secretory pathway pseudopilin PulG
VRIGPAQNPAPTEQGFILIEILVSAVVLVIASAGVVTLLQTTVRSQGEQRHGSEAYAIAQEDQARMGSMQLAALNHLDQTRTVTLNKSEFKVHSTGVFVNDQTSTPSCGVGTSSADYVQVTSTVSWPGMSNSERAKIESILSPSNGSLDPNHGSLAVSVTNELMAPMANVSLSGGSGAFSGLTDAAGCAVFPDLPSGNYSMSVSAEAAGLVNKDGLSTEQKSVGVVGSDTKTVQLQFDHPGTIPVNFKSRVGSTTEFKSANAESVVAYNPSMTSAKALWTTSGIPEAVVNAAPLFPFTSSYTLYAGSCAANNPNPEGKNPAGAAAMATAVAPPGGAAAAVTVQLPVFEATAWTGKNEANKGSGFSSADVWIRDTTCTKGSELVTYRFTASSAGKVPEFALPWGTYNVCADTKTGSGSSRRQRISNVPIQSLAALTSRNFYLGEGSGSQSENGSCP